jgi:chromosome segregation and condensation protein ScpB
MKPSILGKDFASTMNQKRKEKPTGKLSVIEAHIIMAIRYKQEAKLYELVGSVSGSIADIRAALQNLKHRGLIKCVEQKGRSSTWQMTTVKKSKKRR